MRRIGVLSVAAATIALFGFAGGAVAATVVGGTLAGDQVYGQWEDPVFVGTLLDGATGLVYPPGTAPIWRRSACRSASPRPCEPDSIPNDA